MTTPLPAPGEPPYLIAALARPAHTEGQREE